jgi:DNA (cytosine-5)-methyltransferase 1
MRHGSLFSGIGGFDLAAQWMGWENVFHCEMNPFGQQVLAHHFPNSKLHEDVTTFPASDYAGRIDILTGGFPCQPYSTAGKRMGKEDERHLWPAMLDVIRVIQPTWVVGENVRGLVSWNGGLVFEEVCADLEVEGYSVQPYLLPAGGVGAPHRRDRVWFVAYAGMQRGKQKAQRGREKRERQGTELRGNASAVGKRRDAAHADHARTKQLMRGDGQRKESDQGRQGKSLIESWPGCEQWDNFPAQPPICGGDDGLPRELDGITFSKWRNESIKAYGNAIVPQVALQIFKAIQAVDLGNDG